MNRIIFLALLVLIGCAPNDPEPEEAPIAVVRVPRKFLTAADGDSSGGILVGKTLYLGGIVAPDAAAPIAVQTTAAMEQLGALLRQLGLTYSNVVSCHVHLSDMDNYAEMNAVYGSFFEQGAYPARTTLEFPGLPGGAAVMVTCTAYSDSADIEVIRPSEDVIPAAMGPYSSAVRAGETVYVSGQGGRDPKSGDLPEGTGAQTAQTITTIGHILEAADLNFQNVAFAHTYSPPTADASEIDTAFTDRFSVGGAPSRSAVALSRLPGDISTEITFIAADDDYITRLFMYDQEPTALRSPGSLAGETLYASAMAADGETFDEQYEAVVEKHESLLELALMGVGHVVSVRAYLADLGDADEFQRLFAQTFPKGAPVLTVVQANQPDGVRLSVELIAVE